jgi:4-hydroxybenzoate polyprenyltransferase
MELRVSVTSAETRPRRGLLTALVYMVRPKQWVKNFFVFGPLLFSHKMTDPVTDVMAFAAFAIFCGAASTVYVLNDLFDLESDREHPVKRLRPLPAGEITRGMALLVAAVLGAGSIAASLALGWASGAGNALVFTTLVVSYIAINIAYSLALKHVVIIDVMIIGAGFVIRVLAGAAAVAVSPSHWLVLCTILIAVFLAFTKRRAEISLLSEKAGDHRRVLEHYSAAFLDQMISVVTAATLMCYILYTVDRRTIETVAGGSRGLLLTVPFVMYGIFRYLYLVYRQEQGGSPTHALLGDRMIMLDVVLWAALCAVVVYCPYLFKGWFSQAAMP